MACYQFALHVPILTVTSGYSPRGTSSPNSTVEHKLHDERDRDSLPPSAQRLTAQSLAAQSALATEGDASRSLDSCNILQKLEGLKIQLSSSLASKIATDVSLPGLTPMERFFSENPGTIEKLSCCGPPGDHLDE